MPFRESQFENPSFPLSEQPEKNKKRESSTEKKKEAVEETAMPRKEESAGFNNGLELKRIREEFKKLQEVEALDELPEGTHGASKKQETHFLKPEKNTEEKKETAEKEPKDLYLEERFGVVKNKLSGYLPDIYRDIPVKLNYKDQAKDLRIKYSFGKKKIDIETPENLSNKTLEDLEKTRTDFLVFEEVAKGEKISKKIQDFFFLNHEYTHGINQSLVEELRSDSKFNLTEIIKKPELIFQLLTERNSIFPPLKESFSISVERIMSERMLEDPKINENDKEEIKLFWEKHQQSLVGRKLEKSSNSKFNELGEAMTYYKIYSKLGEKGILDFIKNYDSEKLNKIKKYSDIKEGILSEDYKKFLEMDGEELIKNFAKDQKEK